jgi:hypothetical protein
VLGAGELGACVLRELAVLRQQHQVGPISVLLRPGSSSAAAGYAAMMRELDIRIIEADLARATAAELAAVFSAFDQVICCTGFVGGSGTQRKITAAVIEAGVIEAGVKHYIPWQFGVDYDVIGRGSGQDVWDEQLDVRDMLRSQNKVRWSIVSTGMFTSFILLPAFGLVDLEHNVVQALGDWDFQLTVTTPEDIGRLTARIAATPTSFDDQVVYLAGDTFSYRELADTLDHVLDRTMQRRLLSLPQLEADVAAHPDDTMAKYRLAFARKDGVAWPKAHSFNVKQGIAVTDLVSWLQHWSDLDPDPAGD